MTFDFRKLRGRIIEKYGTQDEFAKEYGISRVVLSKKMNNKCSFTSNDIIRMSEMLNIPKEEVGAYFFTEKV